MNDSASRLIKKYPNRRLYDTQTSTYITLADVKQLVMETEEFRVVDAKSGDVIWRRLAGVGPLLNNHYAAGYVGSDGSVYIGTISGVVALVSAS